MDFHKLNPKWIATVELEYSNQSTLIDYLYEEFKKLK